MGTRAMISINEKPFIATHWDGYYDGMGKQLESAKTKAKIISIAKEHNIDFADITNPAIKKLCDTRIQELMKKHNLSEEKIKEGVRRGAIIAVDDYEITDIKRYGDFAEYHYDFTEGVWRVRSVSGAWDENPAFGKWFTMPLNKDQVKEMETGEEPELKGRFGNIDLTEPEKIDSPTDDQNNPTIKRFCTMD